MKSVRTQIIQAVLNDLKKIQQNRALPNNPLQTYNMTVKTVTRALSELVVTSLPAIYLTDAQVTERHLMTDITRATMPVVLSGVVRSTSQKITAIDLLDMLIDDTRATMLNNTTWNGLALATRIMHTEANTEVEEPDASFTMFCEVEFIEMAAAFPASTLTLVPLSVVQGTQPYEQVIEHSFFNAFLTMPGIVWVENADLWPVPYERQPRKKTPGFWFSAAEETYQYTGSTDTVKRINFSGQLVAVDSNPATFQDSVSGWLSKVKNVIGNYADLTGLVNAVDLTVIRSDHSEFPVIRVDTEFIVRYMQSFLLS